MKDKSFRFPCPSFMKIRIITSLVGLPILIALVVMGGIPLKLSILAVSLVGMYEIYSTFREKLLPVHYIVYAFTIAYFLNIRNFSATGYHIFYISMIVVVMLSLVFFYKSYNITDCAIALFGFFYVPLLLSNVFLVRANAYGEFFVWLIFISAWGSDTGAYFVGKSIGKHKLAPNLSAKKTIEGSIGGVLTAGLLGALFAFVITYRYGITYIFDMPIMLLSFILCAVGAIFSQLGDLGASAIKRHVGAKDFGNIFPGHGGVLDRFDSVLVTSPGIYITIMILSMEWMGMIIW